jgi:hypothetical protein
MIKLINLLKETITEISIEQLKTQFVDSGKISQEDFNEITNVTPKTAYITWLAKKVADGIIKVEDIYKYKKYFNIFDRRKKEYLFVDINQYKTPEDLSQFINKSVEIANKESEDISQQKGVSKSDKYAEFKIGTVSGFDVYKLPKGRQDLYGVSCELGSGTEWCTATGKTRVHFNKYISDGPLFIFIKPGSDEKYQFSYETDSFMDKNDRSILNNEKRNFIDFFKFIKEKEPNYEIPIKLKLKYEPDTLDINFFINEFGDKLGKFYYELIYTDILTPEELNIFISSNSLSKYGGLNLHNFDVTLPDNITLQFLNIEGNKKITTLPKNLKIKQVLGARNSSISSIQSGLEAKVAYLSGTELTTLPNNVKIGTLFLTKSKIERLPSDLEVNQLYIGGTPLANMYSKDEIKKMLPNVKDILYLI